MKKIKIILTSGGTAGHIWPIISIIDELKKDSNLEFLYIGSHQGPEKKIAQDQNIPFKGLVVGKWRGYFSLSNIWDLFKTLFGLIQAYFLIIKFKPDVVFAKGGYVTFPVLFWTKKFKIPLVIHESDAIAGKANRWASSFAQKICVGYPIEYYQDIDLSKIIYTGTPVQKEFLNVASVKNEKPTILITGGSQGSVKINQIIESILPELLEKFEVYHQIGLNNFDKKNIFKNINYYPIGFTREMAKIMAKSDLVVSRSGANTLAEISQLAKASILIPFPSAASNHQASNADVYKKSLAAVVISEKELTPDFLLTEINRLMTDQNLRNQMGQNAHEFARPQAAHEIAKIIIDTVK